MHMSAAACGHDHRINSGRQGRCDFDGDRIRGACAQDWRCRRQGSGKAVRRGRSQSQGSVEPIDRFQYQGAGAKLGESDRHFWVQGCDGEIGLRNGDVQRI